MWWQRHACTFFGSDENASKQGKGSIILLTTYPEQVQCGVRATHLGEALQEKCMRSLVGHNDICLTTRESEAGGLIQPV